MNVLHIMAGLSPLSGVANIARRFARRQTERGDSAALLAPACKWNPIYFGAVFAIKALWKARRADEIWVHCSWTFPVWYGAWLARIFRRRLVVVPEGSFDPKRIHNHAGWKKRLVTPLDRWVLRRADEVLALCPEEVGWIRDFEPGASPRFVRVPVFIPGKRAGEQSSKSGEALHVLFLGRAEDPLKGVRFLERALREINAEERRNGEGFSHGERGEHVELRVVSNHTGEELERDWEWCDVLCLPTLSDNFGLVVAEALERGKRVITTDGAPAWEEWGKGEKEEVKGFVYLRGYRDGSDEGRVELLKAALREMGAGF